MIEPGSPKSFLKWAGGKRKIIPALLPHLPVKGRRFVEPFAGSAVVSLTLGSEAKKVWLNDVNPDLVALFEQVARQTDELIAQIEKYFVLRNNEEDRYYALRDAFNAATTGTLERSALFVYLNRHGYNGLCRYNSKGGFNVPFGRYDKVPPPIDEIREAAGVLAGARITSLDFDEVLKECGDGDVVYADPPYVPISKTAFFSDYTIGGFGPADQERLVAAMEAARARGATCVVSNHDTPEVRELYRNAEIETLEVRRNISRDTANRGKASEVIAVYRPGHSKAKSRK